ncbi:MAG: TonB-dependent receptor [Bacteroidia bacterium]
MKRLLLISIQFILINYTYSQTLAVIDNVTLKPLMNVVIYSANPNFTTTTNSKGYTDISEFQTADSIRFKCDGYDELILNFRQLEAMRFTVLMAKKTASTNNVDKNNVIKNQNNTPQSLLVIDKTTLAPLHNLAIYTLKPNLFITTNSNGIADIGKFKDLDSIRFHFMGYYDLILSYKQLEKLQFTVLMSEKTHSLNEIVVSASKFEEKITNVPQQIQVLNRKDLVFMNSQTTADVIQNSGNVLVQKSQAGGGSPIIRGFEANKVLLVIDGVRMNNAIYRGGHLQNILSIDNSIVDKAEIIFGPGSVVYGSDALGGVINFYTKNPILADSNKTALFKGNLSTRFSTVNNEQTGHFNFNVGFKKIAFLTSYTYSDFSDLRQGNIRSPYQGNWGKSKYYAQRIGSKDSMIVNKDVNIQKQTGYKQYDFIEKILLKQNKNIDHLLNFQYSNTSNINRYDRLNEMTSKQKLKYAEWYYGPQKRLLGSYSFNSKANTLLFNDAKIILSYQHVEESRHDRRFDDFKLNHRYENVNVMAVNADFSKTIFSHEIRYGVEATYNEVTSTANVENIYTKNRSSLDTRYPDGGSTMRTIAGYVTHNWKINPMLVLSDGIRYSNIKLHSLFKDATFFPFPFNEVTQKSEAINGNIGLSIMPNEDWRFTILGSTGFRAPNVDDISKVFESVPGNVIIPNPTLKPEYTYNGEISVARIFNKNIKTEVIGFYTLYNNAITTSASTFNGKDSIMYNGQLSAVTTSTNASKAYIYGINGNITADITAAFSITSTINYTYGRIKANPIDQPLDHISPVFGKTSFNLNIKKYRMEFYIMYNGWKRLVDYNLLGEDNIKYAAPEGTPAWYTLNLRTALQINKYVQLQVGLENILDQNYRVFASGISAPGRNLAITLRGRF